ncbi:unnamed protein product [Cuscuta europaea]|uniref:Uncharacterized protein n=1 Tax=Cuscuta europaea TaxID=41803 RepID=A0A9P1ENR6_CUSEU|nr:unnamed protein product [Cuscuta europaea]
MRISLLSPRTVFGYHFLVMVLFLLFLFSSSSSSSTIQVRDFYHPCKNFKTGGSTSATGAACYQLQIIHRCPSFQPPPSDSAEEIDPRYGVQKRLVPSGPNPLHN